MNALLTLFLNLCFFKKGPQDIPASKELFYALIIAYAIISTLLLFIGNDRFDILLQVAVEIALMLGFCWSLLFITKRTTRYQQTASALLATDVLISFLALPAMILLYSQGTAIVFLIIILLMIWHWFISAHIFSQALGQPFYFGLGVAFLYLLVSYIVIDFIFVMPTPEEI